MPMIIGGNGVLKRVLNIKAKGLLIVQIRRILLGMTILDGLDRNDRKPDNT